jgi:pyridoxal phosphate enzyme (YggS family)
MQKYEENFDKILQRIEKARIEANEYNIVNIIAVSKYSSSNDIKELYKIGQRAYGENKVQDLKQKMTDLEDLPLEWHFIGRLQKNKINLLLDLSPTLIQSCDSFELANEINKRAKVKNQKVNILLQINSAKEESKAGARPENAKEIYLNIKENCINLNLKGIMSIGAHTNDTKNIQKSFEITYKIFEELKNSGAKYCSMGMSNDFELAIKCGSNMLRLGSIIFK